MIKDLWYKDKKLVEWEKSMMTMKNDHGGISNRRGREELTSTVCWHLWDASAAP